VRGGPCPPQKPRESVNSSEVNSRLERRWQANFGQGNEIAIPSPVPIPLPQTPLPMLFSVVTMPGMQ